MNGRLIAIGAVLSLGVHVMFGWTAAIPVVIVCGYFATGRPWLAGLVIVLLSWSLLVAYNLVFALEPTLEMMRVVGGLIGNLPAYLIAVVTLLTACLLGAAAGAAGGGVRNIVQRVRR